MAIEARKNSYSPYSKYEVGAAVLAESGKIYTGCNIENAAYGSTICAERTAMVKAVSEGERRFRAIAIVGAPKGEPLLSLCPPCGACRQFMAEFGDGSLELIFGSGENDISVYTLDDFLPYRFDL